MKPAQLQWSRISWGKTHSNIFIAVPTLSWNCSHGLKPLLTLGKNKDFTGSLQDRYKVIYGTITDRYDSENRNCQSSNIDHYWARPMVLVRRNLRSSGGRALGSIVTMTGYRDTYKLDIQMQWLMAMAMELAMAMAMMSSKRKPPFMPLSHNKPYVTSGNFTDLRVFNSDHNPYIIKDTMVKLSF